MLTRLFLILVLIASPALPALAQGNGNGKGGGLPPTASDTAKENAGQKGRPDAGESGKTKPEAGENGKGKPDTPPGKSDTPPGKSQTPPGKSETPAAQAGGNGGSGTPPAAVPAAPAGDANGPLPASGSNAAAPVILTEDQALEAVKARQAEPLSSLAQSAMERTGGKVIDAQLLRVGEILVYAVKVLAPGGRLTTEYYYARSGVFIGSE